MALYHLTHSQREADGHDGRQSLRHRRDRQADRDDKDIRNFFGVRLKINQRTGEKRRYGGGIDQFEHENHRDQNQCTDAKSLPQLIEPTL